MDSPLPPPASIDQPAVSVSDNELLDFLRESNPRIKELDFEIARRQREIELAKKDYFPDVTLGIGYIDTAHSIAGRHPDDDGKDPVIAMLSLNLPIWYDKLAAARREAHHRRVSAVHKRAEKLNSLAVEVKLSAYRFRDAERKIDLYRDTLLPMATQSFKATEMAFRTGKASFLDVIDTQRILLEFALAYERALANRGQSLAKLEMLVGRRIPRIEHEDTTRDGKATSQPKEKDHE